MVRKLKQVEGNGLTNNNKENVDSSASKLGGPTLSVEPQKMKRSKKVDGYNLRKSLAWDRAFLTEEGVLDASELSMISGTIGDEDNLSVIDEQERDSLPMNHASADVETLGEDLFEALPCSYPNKRNPTHSSFMKRDSITTDCTVSVSKPSEKVSPVHGHKKVVCKGEVFSSPMASVSQKKLPNTGTKQIMSRNSKIPKFPISKKNPSVSPMTSIHRAAGGRTLKCTGISQPARKSLSSKISSKSKHTANAAKTSLDSIPISNKPCADVGNDVTNSASQRHSLMIHRAQETNYFCKYSENNSSQGLPTGGIDRIRSSDGTSSSTALSHVHYDNAGLSRKIVKVQGLRPSGLRMPSPSLRFFSETTAPVSSTSSQVTSAPPDSSYRINQGITTARISNQVNNSAEEVENQINLLSCLPNKCDDSAPQTSHLELQLSRTSNQVSNSMEEVEDQINCISCLPNKCDGFVPQTSHVELQSSRIPNQMNNSAEEVEDQINLRSCLAGKCDDSAPQTSHLELQSSRISDQVNNSTEEVGDQINLLSCLPNKYHVSAPQTSLLELQSSRISNQVNNSSEEVPDHNLMCCLPNKCDDSAPQTSHLELQSSGKRSKDQVVADVENPDTEESLCLVNKQEISPRDVLMTKATLEEYIESDEPGCNLSPTESDDITCNTEDIDDVDAITKQRTDEGKLTRPPPNAVPFSDEWLAAIESAGEEILTRKTGAVKHSPPDKPIPERGPWSPVKRKTNQVIGPYDCTKYTNT